MLFSFLLLKERQLRNVNNLLSSGVFLVFFNAWGRFYCIPYLSLGKGVFSPSHWSLILAHMGIITLYYTSACLPLSHESQYHSRVQ